MELPASYARPGYMLRCAAEIRRALCLRLLTTHTSTATPIFRSGIFYAYGFLFPRYMDWYYYPYYYNPYYNNNGGGGGGGVC
jgi:hypothetical protein